MQFSLLLRACLGQRSSYAHFWLKKFRYLLTSFSLPRSWTLKAEINHFKVNNVFALIFMPNLSEYWNKWNSKEAKGQ